MRSELTNTSNARRRWRRTPARAVVLTTLLATLAMSASAHAASSFIGGFTPNPGPLATTVPANGDINPYGIATVAWSAGSEVRGDLLISNFNAASNLQGTGTTIVQLGPAASSHTPASVFAQIPATLKGCPGGIGLTTALGLTANGDVIVGSMPTTDGTSATVGAGCLIVLDDHGHVLETIAGGAIDGPWDLAAVDSGPATTLYVTNVLSGTVSRVQLFSLLGGAPLVLSDTVIATGFPHTADPAALEIGPTGDALGTNGTLYVADSLSNRIAAVSSAATRTSPATSGATTVSTGGSLNDPLGLTLAPGGDIISANGSDGNMVETTPAGRQVATVSADTTGAGVLFGLVVAPGGKGLYFVDDGDNSLRLLH